MLTRRRLLLIAAAVTLAVSAFGLPANAADIGYRTQDVFGVTCRIISVPLSGRDYRMDVEVATGFPGTDEAFESFINRTRPIAAINGTFFGKNDLLPIGDIVKDGKLVYFGGIGTAVCMTKNNDVKFVDVERWTHTDWTPYMTVLAAGPRLLTDGKVTVDPKGQGFSDPHVLGNANRVAIGLTKNDILLLVAVKQAISLEQCAAIMASLGCIDAMNSDGGSSQAMYCKGEYKITAGRGLTNILYIKAYEHGGDALSQVGAGASESMSAEEHYETGQRQASKGKFAAAVESYKLATTLDPNQAAFYNSLAQAYAAQGMIREEAAAIRQAAKIYVTKGIYDIAIKKYGQALKLVGDDPEIYRGLGLAYEGSGDMENAATMYKLAETVAFTQSGTAAPSTVKLKGPEEAVEAPEAVAPEAAPAEDKQPFDSFDGKLEKNKYREHNIGFALFWPEGWKAEVKAAKMTIVLSHESMPFYGTVQAFYVPENESLEDFEQAYIGGSYKTEIRRYNTEVDGAPALRTLYEEIVNDRSCGEQYFYVKKGRWIIVMSFMTYAENYADGGPEFAQIVKGLTLE